MAKVIVEVSKYVMMILFALYTLESFLGLRRKISEESKNRVYRHQIFLMYLLHLDGFLVIYAATDDARMIVFYFAQVALNTMLLICYHLIYRNASKSVANNMCMLLVVGFIILTRISFDKAVKQYIIAVASAVITAFIPIIIRKTSGLRKMTYVYAGVGIVALLLVAVMGSTSYGAKISISIAGISIQPSEFVKILFVFFVAGMLYENTEFKQVCIATALAALHVLILVASRDLGGALIFFVTYLIMLYVATRKLFYLAGGILSGCIASVVAYGLFSHVRVRVLAWQDPLSVIDNEGYQICQSLFAIGTGGWF